VEDPIIPRFLLDEILRIRDGANYESRWLAKHPADEIQGELKKFTFKSNGIYLFISGAPCGDACLDLLTENPDYSVPWATTSGQNMDLLHGHEYVWLRGKVRLKPGRYPFGNY